MTEDIRLEIDDRVATVTLNRPERMNAFTFDMMDAWQRALEECRRNDAVHVIVVTGAGKAFCSGGDIADMQKRFGQTPGQRKDELSRHVQRIPLMLEDIDKPVLVAVNGVATGAGMDLALMGDIRYAAESARFAETYVRVGLVPGAGGAHFLPRLVGTSKALELFWTADFIDAAEALRLGLVNKVLPDEELLPFVRQTATKIAWMPTYSVRLIKRAIYEGMRNDLRANLDLISSHYAVATASEDHKKAVEAFLARAKK